MNWTSWKDYQIPEISNNRNVCAWCFPVLLLYEFAVFGCSQSEKKRCEVRPHRNNHSQDCRTAWRLNWTNTAKPYCDKYKDIHFENYMALPVISNQKMNDYLKELGELAEINETCTGNLLQGNERIDEVTPKYALLSTHAGRRTFICNALALGIPAQVVMKWTGHSDYKAMKPYIDTCRMILRQMPWTSLINYKVSNSLDSYQWLYL